MTSITHQTTATRAPSGSSLLALVGASLPMNLDPAIHNIAVVAAGVVVVVGGVAAGLSRSLLLLLLWCCCCCRC